jgi:hypothetical protein
MSEAMKWLKPNYLWLVFLPLSAFGQQPQPTDVAMGKLEAICKSAQAQVLSLSKETGRMFSLQCSEGFPQPEKRKEIKIALTPTEKTMILHLRNLEDAAWGANYDFERQVFINHGVMFLDTGRWNPKGTSFSNSKCGITPMIIANTFEITLTSFGFGKDTEECQLWKDTLYERFVGTHE